MMIAGFFVLVLTGMPVAFAVAATAFIFGFLGFGGGLFSLLPSQIFGTITNYTLLAIPLFVFMGVMLDKSQVAERMLDSIGRLAGGLPGGMALAVVLVGILMGASTGIVGATIVTLTLIALPTLLRRGYSTPVATGTICASGTLGQIIPPTLVLLVLADVMNMSVGRLFAGALIPGLMLGGLYLVYLLMLGWLKPDYMPPVAAAERAQYSARQLSKDVLTTVVPPLALVVAVLGSIIGGVAAPTEAASVGAVGTVVLAALARRLNRATIMATLASSVRITAMVFFVLIAAQAFALAFRGLNGEFLINSMFELVPGGAYGALILMLVIIFLLGFFLEWIQITFIVVPLFLPTLGAYPEFSLVWIGILVALNLQTSFLTPPFGWSLIFMKGVAPRGVSTGAIYKGAVPFVLIQLLALVLVLIFPGLVEWLPEAIGW